MPSKISMKSVGDNYYVNNHKWIRYAELNLFFSSRCF